MDQQERRAPHTGMLHADPYVGRAYNIRVKQETKAVMDKKKAYWCEKHQCWTASDFCAKCEVEEIKEDFINDPKGSLKRFIERELKT